MFKFILLTAIFAFSGAEAFWSSCRGSVAIAPRQIISPLCNENLCIFARGKPLVADAYLTFNKAHLELKVKVTAYVLGVAINLPQLPPSDNACNSLTLGGLQHGCPTVPGVEKVWKINTLIPVNYPVFQNARVRFELFDNNAVVACADVNASMS